MPINNTGETLSWREGKTYEPGAKIPQDLADALKTEEDAEVEETPQEPGEGEVAAIESGSGDEIIVPTEDKITEVVTADPQQIINSSDAESTTTRKRK